MRHNELKLKILNVTGNAFLDFCNATQYRRVLSLACMNRNSLQEFWNKVTAMWAAGNSVNLKLPIWKWIILWKHQFICASLSTYKWRKWFMPSWLSIVFLLFSFIHSLSDKRGATFVLAIFFWHFRPLNVKIKSAETTNGCHR